MPLLERDDSVLLVIDAQEHFYGPDRSDVDEAQLASSFDRSGWLVAVAGAVGVPVIATEEEADHNGSTDARVARHFPRDTVVLDKTFFGAPDNPSIMAAIDATGRSTVVVVGLETDVCVAHTLLLLQQRGLRAVGVEDCLYSPGAAHEAGLKRLRAAAIELLSAKGVFYDWVRSVDGLDQVCDSHPFVRHPPGFHL